MSEQDRAYWISWYNLPEQNREAYFDWLHDKYMPMVVKRAGVLWGAHYASEANVVPLGGGKGRVSHVRPDAVPTGDRYIVIFGAESAHAFANPAPQRFHAELPENDQGMLAMRIGERTNIMLEEARVHGPEKPDRGIAPTPCIQLGSFNSGSLEEEDEMLTWYARWRLPSMQNVPGCVRVRKLVSVSGWAKHACFYEFTSLEARNEHFVHYERSNPEMETWSKQVVKNTIHAPGSANVARRIKLEVK